jgi:hypothetical protein
VKYYLHNDSGDVNAYFGNIGTPFRVSFFRYLIAKLDGCVATKAPNGYSIGEVHIKAQIEAGAHPKSYKVTELKKKYKINS